MTYIATDQSTQSGAPAYLFLVTQGGNTWRYTNLAYNVIADSQTWIPAPIQLSSIAQTNDIIKDTVRISLPFNHALATALLEDTIDEIFSLTIYRGHMTDIDNEFVIHWRGRVSSITASTQIIELECEPIFTSLKRPGLRARYQKVCRHALYQSGCNVTEASFSFSSNVIAHSSLTLTLDVDPSPSAGYFIGGAISYGGVKRFIVNHSGTTLTLNRLFTDLTDEVDLSSTAAVTLYAGCNHTVDHCLNKFNNLANFGGFPYIPYKNPMGGNSIA